MTGLARTLRSARIALWCGGVLAFAWLSCGCATDQGADVARYRAISDPPGGSATPEEGPISLVEAMRRTAMLNERLASAGEDYVQALADRQRAAAALRPTVDVFGQLALKENTGSAGVVQSSDGVAGQYRILTGLSDLRSVRAAEATIEARRWLILDLRESLLLETANAYYESLRSERLVHVLESSVAAQFERLQDARARNEVGFARPLDVAQNESLVSRTRTQLITAVRQAGEARAALTLLTESDVGAAELTDGYVLSSEQRGVDELLAIARRYRQDLLSARAEANGARELVDAAIGQYAPSITLNLDYFLVRGPDDAGASVASLIEARVPVFSAGRIEADVRRAWSVFRQRVLDYRLREREVRRDVETALLRMRSSAERANELGTQVRAARDALQLAEAAYQAGLGTNLELVTAQDQLLAAELEATSEEFTSKAASLSLRRACGLLSVELLGSPLPEIDDEELRAPESPVLDRRADSVGGA